MIMLFVVLTDCRMPVTLCCRQKIVIASSLLCQFSTRLVGLGPLRLFPSRPSMSMLMDIRSKTSMGMFLLKDKRSHAHGLPVEVMTTRFGSRKAVIFTRVANATVRVCLILAGHISFQYKSDHDGVAAAVRKSSTTRRGAGTS
jgi:hypothetical protein